jgi:hypothetical protein
MPSSSRAHSPLLTQQQTCTTHTTWILMWQLNGGIHCCCRHTGVPIHCLINYTTDWVAQSVWNSPWVGRSGDQTPAGVRFSIPIQTVPGAHPASYTLGTKSFPKVKQPGCCVKHPSTTSAKVKGTVELYLNSSSVPSWQIIGWNSPLPLLGMRIQNMSKNPTTTFTHHLTTVGTVYTDKSTKQTLKSLWVLSTGSATRYSYIFIPIW